MTGSGQLETGGARERAAPIPRRWHHTVLDLLAVVGVVVLLVFPFAATASVSTAAAVAGVSLPPLPARAARGSALRDLPVFTPSGPVAAAFAGKERLDLSTAEALVADRASATFGAAGDGGLVALAGCEDFACPAGHLTIARDASGAAATLLHWSEIDTILDRQLGTAPLPADRATAATDLAGLLLLTHGNTATPVAYALYDRARARGGCDPQLDLALLTSTYRFDDASTGDSRGYAATEREYERAVAACPDGDPTALWMLGEYESIEHRLGPALDVFHRLERRMPGSVLGWSGEADALVREGYRVQVASPFAARAHFRRAASLYDRARGLGGGRTGGAASIDDHDPGLLAGAGRAHSGAADYAAAAALERTLVHRLPAATGEPYRLRLIDDLEHAARVAPDRNARHAFFAAAATVDRPEAGTSPSTGAGTVPGPGLFPFEPLELSSAAVVGGVAEQGALQPISVGATRLRDFQGFRALAFALPLTDAVEDLSFVPEYRELGSVNARDHCRAIRDLYLAGRPRRAAAELAQSPVTISGTRACWEVGSLTTIVDAAAGKATERTAASFDDEQNLLRFAGDLPGAAAATLRWRASHPRDANASARAGEVAFLRRRYTEAAGEFAAAAKLDTSAPGREARTRLLLQQGAALGLAGKRDEARTVLAEADRSAGALLPPTWPGIRPEDGSFAAAQAALDSYNARLALGDLALREHEPDMNARASDRVLTRAVTHFEAARAREGELRDHEARTPPGQRAFDPLDPPFRPEVLENNEALALVALGRTADAARAVDAAVATDPANPIFLGNRGFVEEQSGYVAAARRSYRAAVDADPTAATAANNLGVLLAHDGHLGAATAAFRHAIEARHAAADEARAHVARDDAEPVEPDYAIAEFNLGLTLGRMGPAHVAESQGWLAAAIRADPELREQDHELVTDDQLYFTTLDLSKPLPPEWHLASAEQRVPTTVAGVAVFILIVTMLQVFLLDQLKDKVTEDALERGDRRLTRVRKLGERIPGWVAVVAVAAVFAYPLLRSSGTSVSDYLLVLVGVGILVFASMRIRLAFTRRAGVTTRHYAHVPALVVAGAATALGGAFAPMPAPTEHDAIPVAARWTAIGFLGFMTAALLTIGHVTDVPITTLLGEAALVLTASALVPIKPFDGAYLERSHVIAAAGFTLAVVGLLVGQGII